ncbi:hypothetical protein SGPA1_21981 [Streptomyces misionensis JCM 4497]
MTGPCRRSRTSLPGTDHPRGQRSRRRRHPQLGRPPLRRLLRLHEGEPRRPRPPGHPHRRAHGGPGPHRRGHPQTPRHLERDLDPSSQQWQGIATCYEKTAQSKAKDRSASLTGRMTILSMYSCVRVRACGAAPPFLERAVHE